VEFNFRKRIVCIAVQRSTALLYRASVIKATKFGLQLGRLVPRLAVCAKERSEMGHAESVDQHANNEVIVGLPRGNRSKQA
jgi:hypothetical protein